MISVIEIAISFVSQMMMYLSTTGVHPPTFLKEANVPLDLNESPDTRVSIEDFYRIQEHAVQTTKDPFFGLHVGEFVAPGTWSILGYIVMNCATLHDALERICRYHEIVGNFIRIRMRVKKEEVILFFEIKLPDANNTRHCYEASASSIVSLIKTLGTKEFFLKQASFSHGNQHDISEYQRIFQCPVLFNATGTTLVFNRTDLASPIAMHNPRLLALFEQHAENYLKLIHSEHYYTKKVNELILRFLPDGTPSIQQVAGELSMSVRSLQGRLSSEGVTYRKLLEEIRKELAVFYLNENNLSIEDITYLLGFSEPGIFRKQFKQWMGITPTCYRTP